MQSNELVTATLTYSVKECQVIRLWHWRKVLGYREFAEQPSNRHRKGDLNRRANFHMRAVQALNDVCPVGTTAEGDEIDEQYRLAEIKRKRNAEMANLAGSRREVKGEVSVTIKNARVVLRGFVDGQD